MAWQIMLGWLGSIIYLAAYLLLSFGLLRGESSRIN
jgi:hypothetical protein